MHKPKKGDTLWIQTENTVCFYCGAPSATLFYDHFPTRKCDGGHKVVLACHGCHEMKDYVTIKEWTLDWIGAVFRQFQDFSFLTDGAAELTSFENIPAQLRDEVLMLFRQQAGMCRYRELKLYLARILAHKPPSGLGI